MHNALSATIEEGVRARTESSKAQLTELVEALARKFNSALAPNADNGAMQALESQIKQLSVRLDRNDGNGAVLASIEHKLGEVFGRIEEASASSTEAAEAAVRRATLEALRQVGTVAAPLDPAFKEELDDLRRAQEENGERTHETLAAVHETLERVVDRLAAFEDEITEICGEGLASESSFESGPPRREVQNAADDAARYAAREFGSALSLRSCKRIAPSRSSRPHRRARAGAKTSKTWISICSPKPSLELRAGKRRRNPTSSPPRAGPRYRRRRIPRRWTRRKKSDARRRAKPLKTLA